MKVQDFLWSLSKKKTVSRIRFPESTCKNKDVLGPGYALTDGKCCICLFNC